MAEGDWIPAQGDSLPISFFPVRLARGLVMNETATPNPALMRSLGRLVRGLSALFWGLPLAFLTCFYTARAEPLRLFGVLPSMICTSLLLYGLWQVGAFQKQERIWRAALDRARLLTLVNIGLCPFLYWSNRVPEESFFSLMMVLQMFFAMFLLASLNLVLRRLAAMLPDEALRQETRQFTLLNLNLVAVLFVLALVNVLLHYAPLDRVLQFSQPNWLGLLLRLLQWLDLGSQWLLTFLVLLPLAMTMALLWKTKEVILDGVFGVKS